MKLKILGQTWTLRYADQDPTDKKCFGVTDSYLRTITLYRKPHQKYPARGPMAQSLFHETLHAALISSGLEELLDDKLHEAVVRVLEEAIWPLVASGVFRTVPNVPKRR